MLIILFFFNIMAPLRPVKSHNSELPGHPQLSARCERVGQLLEVILMGDLSENSMGKNAGSC